jgi:nucleotide-binding universal stress UspA family protein
MAMENAEIVAGVDGSPQAEDAVRWAASRAQHTGARLRLLHAHAVSVPAKPLAATASDDCLAKAGEAVLTTATDIAHDQAPDIELITDLCAEGVAPALIDISVGASLVVVGSRGLGGFKGMLLGSVGTRVSGHAHCSTVVMRDRTTATGPLVVGVDGSESAATALAFAFTEAHRLGTTVVAVHAWSMHQPIGPAEAATIAMATGDDQAQYQKAAQEVLTPRGGRLPSEAPRRAGNRAAHRRQPRRVGSADVDSATGPARAEGESGRGSRRSPAAVPSTRTRGRTRHGLHRIAGLATDDVRASVAGGGRNSGWAVTTCTPVA